MVSALKREGFVEDGQSRLRSGLYHQSCLIAWILLGSRKAGLCYPMLSQIRSVDQAASKVSSASAAPSPRADGEEAGPELANRGLNAGLWSPKMLVTVSAGSLALLALNWLTTTVTGATAASAASPAIATSPLTAGEFALRPTLLLWAALTSAMSVVIHEKIARCDSPYVERVARYSALLALLLFIPPLLYIGVAPAWPVLLSTVISPLALGAITVAACYRFDPQGPGRYFSISAKFNGR